MQVVSNWRALARRAWSVRLVGLALALELASQVVPYFTEYVPRWGVVLALAGGLAARFIDQGLQK